MIKTTPAGRIGVSTCVRSLCKKGEVEVYPMMM